MYGRKFDIRWAVVGECIQGAAHIRQGKPCQDALKYYHAQELGVICTLADGHGSERCRYSSDGSVIATSVALSIMQTILWHHTDEKLYQEIRNIKDVTLPKRIEREWKEQVQLFHQSKGREPVKTDKALYNLYGTTLIILFITRDFIFSMQIGDGDVLAIFESGETVWLLEPEMQYGTETYSLCQNSSWKYFKSKLISISEYTAVPVLFLASTDGYANSFVSSNEFLKIGKDYLEVIKTMPISIIKSYLKEWLNDASRCGSGDDISFILVYNKCLEMSAKGALYEKKDSR